MNIGDSTNARLAKYEGLAEGEIQRGEFDGVTTVMLLFRVSDEPGKEILTLALGLTDLAQLGVDCVEALERLLGPNQALLLNPGTTSPEGTDS